MSGATQILTALLGAVAAVSLLVGGLIGLLLATAASVGLTQVLKVPYVFNGQINVTAFVFSGAMGVLFGYLPAKRAAGLDPIEALRHE